MRESTKIIVTGLVIIVLVLALKTFFSYVAPANAQGLSPFGSWDSNGSYHHPNGKTKKFESDGDWEWDWGYEVKPVPQYNVNPGPRPVIYPEEPDIIELENSEEPGTVIIDTKNKLLFYTIDENNALMYPIAVGRKGFQWTGVEKVSRIEDWPAWNPPAEMRARQPGLPERMEGGINNPLGAVAIYLGNTLYRIHGSNDPKSIGTEASSGCFRMHNAHAVHLASLVTVGTIVKVY